MGTKAARSADTRRAFRSHTVLIADDQPEILTALRRLLREEPYDLVTCDSAETRRSAKRCARSPRWAGTSETTETPAGRCSEEGTRTFSSWNVAPCWRSDVINPEAIHPGGASHI